MGRPKKYSDEFRRRAVDEVLERSRAIPEVASSLGITSNETLRRWDCLPLSISICRVRNLWLIAKELHSKGKDPGLAGVLPTSGLSRPNSQPAAFVPWVAT